jgi:MYXO-CTERM domain-containing protein
VFPASGSALVGVADVAHLVVDDFNATARDGQADVGAYKFDADGNPGWTLGPGFKDLPAEPGAGGGPGVGGGGPGAGGAAAGSGGDGPGPAGPGSGGGGGDGAQDADDGCSCRAAGAGDAAGGTWLFIAAAIAAFARRARCERAN